MNMKKVTSLVIVIAMLLSMFTVTSFAAGETLEVTYEKITNTGVTDIKKDDVFYAVITLKGITDELQGGNFRLNFDPSVLQLVNASYNPVNVFNTVVNSPIHNTAIFDGPWEDYGMEDAKAFSTVTAGNTVNNTTGTVDYNFATKIYDGVSYKNYQLTADQKANGLLFIKLRFKAVGYGNANISFVTSATSFKRVGQEPVFMPTNVTPLTIAPDVVTYTATFKADGATVYTESVESGNKVANIPAVPAKDGYTGVWSPDPANTVITADTEFTAVYTEIPPTKFKATFVADESTIYEEDVVEGEKVASVPAVPAKVGYTGVWSPDPANTAITANTTFTAVYTINTYTVTFLADGETVATKTVDHGATLTDIPAVPEKDGYTAAWDTTDFSNITANMTVTAVYELIPVSGTTAQLITLTDVVPGTVVQIPVKFTELPVGTKSFDFGLTYDSSKLEYVPEGLVKGTGYSTDPEVNYETLGALGVAGLTTDEGVSGDQVVVTLSFRVLMTAEDGTAALTLVNVRYGDINNANNLIDSDKIVNGAVVVKNPIDPLQIAKDAALLDLAAAFASYSEANYYAADWTTLTGANATGIANINAATTIDAVNTAKSDAIAAMAAVPTKEQRDAEALANAKVDAKAALATAFASYSEASYYAEDWATLTAAKAAGDTAIDAATTIDAVNTAKNDAIAAMAAVPTKANAALVKVNSGVYTLDDLKATGATGITDDNFKAYQLLMPIQKELNDGAELTLADVNTVIATANGVTPDMRGDVISGGSEDGVYANDAAAVKQFLLRVGIEKTTLTLAQVARADYDNDGIINVGDIVNILIKAAKNNVPQD